LAYQLSDLLEGGDASKEKREKEARRRKVESTCLLYWYKSTCFTGTKVQILTQVSALQKRRSKLLGTWEGIGAFVAGIM
jgi:hypothetical protein